MQVLDAAVTGGWDMLLPYRLRPAERGRSGRAGGAGTACVSTNEMVHTPELIRAAGAWATASKNNKNKRNKRNKKKTSEGAIEAGGNGNKINISPPFHIPLSPLLSAQYLDLDTGGKEHMKHLQPTNSAAALNISACVNYQRLGEIYLQVSQSRSLRFKSQVSFSLY